MRAIRKTGTSSSLPFRNTGRSFLSSNAPTTNDDDNAISIKTSWETAPSNPNDSLIGNSSYGPLGKSTDTNSMRIVSSRRLTSSDSDAVTAAGKPVVGLKDIPRVFENSQRFTQVTPEQIERVRRMHERFRQDANFSFNYNTLLTVASILAGLGLASNSSTTVIASMLVSPIMGPVVGMAYGASISDWRLFRTSLRTECLSLVFCVLIGGILGGIIGPTNVSDDWPTSEMAIRGTLQNFYLGLPIAFFSGMGVAVGLLDSQTNSLVGVAISASLLPPAVNCGMLWVCFWFYERGIFEPEISRSEFYTGGVFSLLLTIANIVLVIVSAMVMFRVKERLPIQKSVFWDDLGVARKIYRNLALMPKKTQDVLYPQGGQTRFFRFQAADAAQGSDVSSQAAAAAVEQDLSGFLDYGIRDGGRMPTRQLSVADLENVLEAVALDGEEALQELHKIDEEIGDAGSASRAAEDVTMAKETAIHPLHAGVEAFHTVTDKAIEAKDNIKQNLMEKGLLPHLPRSASPTSSMHGPDNV